ncbi:hypothetical protein [Streptomyces endophytica]|uniref:Uncharacterized protein n=1 Tax=Streptomyces endophytica TaxID=2991496 RepID=A0ABY6P8T4_9ACTN|nr:hypothetical protein [Streptomyces endophytica]UZJ30233.1 hypothetical protein OJ254_07215 [Streptomyces endophytica]
MTGDFRLAVGHRYETRGLPRPTAHFSGTVVAEVVAQLVAELVAFEPWALEPEGRGTRLFLVHEGFGRTARTRYRCTASWAAAGERSWGRAWAGARRAVTGAAPAVVHVHLRMHPHVNAAMIPGS